MVTNPPDYTPEQLLTQLPALRDQLLKQNFLNTSNWREPMARILALVEDEAQAIRVVKLALEVN